MVNFINTTFILYLLPFSVLESKSSLFCESRPKYPANVLSSSNVGLRLFSGFNLAEFKFHKVSKKCKGAFTRGVQSVKSKSRVI